MFGPLGLIFEALGMILGVLGTFLGPWGSLSGALGLIFEAWRSFGGFWGTFGQKNWPSSMVVMDLVTILGGFGPHFGGPGVHFWSLGGHFWSTFAKHVFSRNISKTNAKLMIWGVEGVTFHPEGVQK